jgi:cell shape-determining protein MreC
MDYFWLNLDSNINEYEINNNYCTNITKEYTELSNMLDISTLSNNLVITKIKYRDIYNFKNYITIYKGYKDNINVGDIVIDKNNYLVGVISTTYSHSSIVRLITNEESNISVKVNEAYGMLKYIDGNLVVTDINNYENINIKDEVTSSGIGLLPGGYFIGTVSKLTHDLTGIEQILLIDNTINIDNLKYLYIVRST